MWDQLVSTAAARYTCPPRTLRSATGPNAFPNVTLTGGDPAISSTSRCASIVAILATLMNDPWCGIPRASTFQSAPRSRLSELWQVRVMTIVYYFTSFTVTLKWSVKFCTCDSTIHRIHKIFIIRETFSFKIYDYSCYQVCAAQTNSRHFGERSFFSR